MKEFPKGDIRSDPQNLQAGNSERKQASEEQATDALISSPWTRSASRTRFRLALQQAIEKRDKNPNYLFAVLYADLDRFSLINDSLGKEVGDQLLVEVTRRLQSCIPNDSLLVRLREDEYLIFLNNIHNFAILQEFTVKVKEALRPVFRLMRHEVFVSASMGIALGPHGYSRADDIVKDAESAMHRSKNKGPGSSEIFDARLHEEAKVLLTRETQLRKALDSHQFQLQYEPIISLESGRIAGFEALIRWQHPERGIVYPGEFVQTAEENGMILPITRWVLQEACRQLKKWQDDIPEFSSLWLSVNLSPIYMKNSDFSQELSTFISKSGVDSSKLVMEITESQLLENAESILNSFAQLHGTGVKLWIDDFGAGYSSLSYLVNFPIHSLKVDRSFISKLVQDNKSLVITKAIISLAQSLGVNAIAEGAETKDQIDCLRSMGCPYVQGHYYSRAILGDAIEGLIRGQVKNS